MIPIRKRKKWKIRSLKKEGQNLEGTEIRRRKTEIKGIRKKKEREGVPER